MSQLMRHNQMRRLLQLFLFHEAFFFFQCGVCGKAYTHSGSLNVHARVHSQERPFQCRVCCKAFAEKTVLNKHAATHSGIKPFQCDSCGKPFRYCVGAKICSDFLFGKERSFPLSSLCEDIFAIEKFCHELKNNYK